MSLSKSLRRFSGETAFVHHRRTAVRTEDRNFTAFVLPSEDAYWRFAAVASKRLGGAVERNRAKRRLRMAFASARQGVYGVLWVILYAKRPVLKAKFKELELSLEKILAKADR